MTIVLSTIFKSNIENFAVYLLSGQILFNFMDASTKGAIFSIVDNGPIIKKTYVPKSIFVVARVTSCLVDLIFSLGALLVVMLVTRTQFSRYIIFFAVILIQLYIFCLGLSLCLSAANVFFRDIQYIYNAIVTAWSYFTPLFYPIELLPDHIRNLITTVNPMYYYVKQFRDIVYYQTFPETDLMVKGVVVGMITLVFGYWVFNKTEDKFILYI